MLSCICLFLYLSSVCFYFHLNFFFYVSVLQKKSLKLIGYHLNHENYKKVLSTIPVSKLTTILPPLLLPVFVCMPPSICGHNKRCPFYLYQIIIAQRYIDAAPVNITLWWMMNERNELAVLLPFLLLLFVATYRSWLLFDKSVRRLESYVPSIFYPECITCRKIYWLTWTVELTTLDWKVHRIISP